MRAARLQPGRATPGTIPGPNAPWPGRLGWWVFGTLLLIAVVFWLADRLVDWLWMGSLGYRPVFWTILDLRFSLFAGAFVLLAAYFWLNLRWALRMSAALQRAAGAPPAPPIAVLDRSPLLQLTAAGVLAFLLAIGFAGLWDDALRFYFGPSFGIADPLLGRDVGFYVFRLPLLEALRRAAFYLAALGVAGQATLAVMLGAFRDWPQLDDHLRGRVATPLGWNLALLGLAASFGYVLDRFRLLYASSGTVWGPGFVDVHVVMPGLWVLAALAVVAAALAVFAARRNSLRLMAWAIGGVAVAHVVILGLLPGAIQAFYVDPNELARERPYLEHNIAFTRQAFAIDGVEERSYPAESGLTMGDLADNRDTIRNVRLWDYRPLLRTFRQIQQIRLYYQFYDVDVDRYRLDDGYRQTMLAARELTPDLPQRADTWVNRHLQFTHGYGIAMSLAAQEGEEGSPTLVVKDLPPVASRGAPIGNPAIYFGEHMPDFRIVPSGIRELDYPAGDENVYASYQGAGGVPIGSFWARLLFAFHLTDINVLLTDYTTESSRIQIRLSLQDRIHRIAPFLELDRDPYMVTTPEGLYWIQDAYTESDRYPYSEPYSSSGPSAAGARFNYIRNSVKVVVDAYEGSVAFYVMDPRDPVLAAYRQAFPGLFHPLDEMPENLRVHLRYPEDLFRAQIARYAAYHMRDPQVFYNKEDLWTVPQEKYGDTAVAVEPYYILMRLPGESRLEFMLMLPMTPQGRDNLIAWISARSDFPDYGSLVAFKLPKERLVYGPMQVEALIDQNTEISRQLSLWDQRGSRVLRGNLLVIPIDHSLLYVEPVYLVAEQNDLPQLKRVIAVQGDRVAMEPTLEKALEVLFGGATSTAGSTPVRSERITEIRNRLGEAEAALARGDWAAFGVAMQGLKGIAEPGIGDAGGVGPGAPDEGQ